MDPRRTAARGEGGREAAQPAAMCAEEVCAPLGPCSHHAAKTRGQRVARDVTVRGSDLFSRLFSCPDFSRYLTAQITPP